MSSQAMAPALSDLLDDQMRLGAWVPDYEASERSSLVEPSQRLLTGLVLVVCRGNICRSPTAEAMLARTLAPLGVDVASAGLEAVDGDVIPAAMLALWPEVGDRRVDQFSARRLTPALVESADLVLTSSRRQRSETVRMSPRALRRTFTLREFAILSKLVQQHVEESRSGPFDSVGDLVSFVPQIRGAQRILDDEFDVPDPMGRSTAAYQNAYALIEDATTTISAAIYAVQKAPGDLAY